MKKRFDEALLSGEIGRDGSVNSKKKTYVYSGESFDHALLYGKADRYGNKTNRETAYSRGANIVTDEEREAALKKAREALSKQNNASKRVSEAAQQAAAYQASSMLTADNYEQQKEELKQDKKEARSDRASNWFKMAGTYLNPNATDTEKAIAKSTYTASKLRHQNVSDDYDILKENQWNATQEKNAQIIASNSEIQSLVEQARNAKINADAAQKNIDHFQPLSGNGNVSGNLALQEQQKNYQAEYNTYSEIISKLDNLGYDGESLVDTYSRQKNLEEMEEFSGEVSDFASEHPVASSAAYVALNSAQSEALPDIIQGGLSALINDEYVPLDINSGSFGATNIRDTIAETNSENIENTVQEKTNSEFLANASSFLYQTGLSMGDFASLAALPQSASLAIMGSSAAASTAKDATERGLSADNALATATAAAAAEVFFEKFSLEGLQALKATGRGGIKNTVKDILKQSFTEGSEEFFTDISNAITDQIINGDDSALYQQYQSYIDGGMTSQQAQKQVAIDYAKQVGQSFLGGAISGGVLGTGATALRNAQLNSAYRAEGRAIQDTGREGVAAVINEGLAQDSNSPAYKAASELLSRNDETDSYEIPETLSGRDLGKLGRLQQMNVRANDVSAFSEAVSGEENSESLIKTFEKLTKGENINRKDANALMNNKTARTALSELTAIDEIGSGNVKNNRKLLGRVSDFYRDNTMQTFSASEPMNNEQTRQYLNRRLNSVGLQSENEATGTITSRSISNDSVNRAITAPDGTADSVQSINCVENGIVYLNTANGNVVEAQNVDFADSQTADLYNSAAAYDTDTAKVYTFGFTDNGYSGSVYDYNTGFNAVYRAQKQGYSLDDAFNLARESSNITPMQAELAYNAAKNEDVQTPETVLTETDKTSSANVKPSETGAEKATKINKTKQVEFNKALNAKKKPGATVIAEKMSKSQKAEADLIGEYAKSIGREVIVVDDTEELGYGAANGMYQNGKIVLALNNTGGVMSVYFGHELFHDLKQTAPKQANELQEYVLDRLKSNADYNYDFRYAQLEDKYSDNLKGKTDAQKKSVIDEEIAANACFTVLSNENNFTALVKQNRSLAEKVRDFFADFIEKIKNALTRLAKNNAEYRALQNDTEAKEKILAMFNKALESSDINLNKSNEVKFSKVGKTDDGRTIYKTNYETHTPKAIKQQDIINLVQNVWSRLPIELNIVKNGKTVPILARFNPNLSERSDLSKIAFGNRKGNASEKRMTLDLASDLYSIAEEAQYVKSKAETGKNNPAHKNVSQWHYFITNLVYRDENNQDIDCYMNIDVKKTNDGNWFYSFAIEKGTAPQTLLAVVTDETTATVPTNSISNTDENVKFSLKTDSAGNELSEQQQEYFKDSKVRDEDGHLLVMYHGTPNAGFTRFRSGAYFTQNREYADRYQYPGASSISVKTTENNPDTYKVYLNIKKPFDTRNATEREIFENEFYMKWGNGSPLSDRGLPDWVEAMDLQEFIEENGYDYDGLILDEGADGGYGMPVIDRGISYVTFNSNQVKNVDNKNPTDDDDIRFSLKEPVEETKDLIAVHNISESNLLKSLDLGGFPMPSIAVMKAQQADANADYGDISVVFRKDTIDPEVNRSNKVYGGDAWTPRFPTIEYEIDYDQVSNIYSRAHELSKTKAAFTKAVSLHPDNIENGINRWGFDKYLENLKDDYTIKQLYLLERGEQPVEMQQREERAEVSEADAALYDYLLDAIPDYHYVSPFQWNKTYGAAFDQAYTDYYQNNFGFTEEQAENILKNMNTAQKKSMMRAAQNYKENGRVTVTVSDDTNATEALIDSKIDQSDFENWVDDTFAGITKSQGIRNDVEPYTSSGNSRSFSELHYEVTLENLVRQMKTQGNGEGTFFSGLGIWGVAAKNYGTIEALKSDSIRLQNLSDEKYSEIKQGFGERLTEISNILDSRYKSDNPFIEEDNKMTNIIDALRSSKTKSGVLRYLNEYFTNASESTVDDLLDLVADIGNMPTQYFEAKPQRAVFFNEVAYVVIPDNASEELKSKLNENGIEYKEYQAGNEQSRVDTLNSLDDVKFSMKEEDNTSVFEDNDELAESAEDVRNMLRLVSTENNELRKAFDIQTVRTAEDSSVAKVAAYLRKQYDSTYKKSDLVSNLAGLYNYITNAGENIDNEYVWRTAKSIAANVLANTYYKDTTVYEESKALRDRIRSQAIRVPESVKKDITDYNVFRKRNFGRMRLGNDSGISLDELYKDLSTDNPEFFPPDAVLGEQLENIEDFFVATAPVYYNGAEMMAESEGLSLDKYTNIVAADIFNKYFDVPEVKEYVSESHQREMQEIKADYETQIKDMRSLYRQRYEDQLAEIRRENEKRLADMKDKNDVALKQIKEKNLETIAKQKAHFKDVSKRATQRRNASKIRESIRRNLRKIARMGAKPDKKKHIPNAIIDSVKTFADAIVLDDTKQDQKIRDRLNQFRDAFENAGAGNENSQYAVISELYNDFIKNKIIELNNTVGDKTIKQLSVSELTEIDKLIKATAQTINNINRLFLKEQNATIERYANRVRDELSPLRKEKVFNNSVKTLMFNSMKPEYFFQYLGSDAMLELYHDLRHGEDVWALDISQAREKALELRRKYGWHNWDSKTKRKFNSVDGEIELTLQERLGIYANSLGEHTKNHLLGGGFKYQQPQHKNLKSKFSRDNNDNSAHRLSEADVSDIVLSLTDDQMAYVRDMIEYLSTVMGAKGNEISRVLYDMDLFTEKMYYPAKVDSESRHQSSKDVRAEKQIKNAGFTNAAIQDAKQPIILMDFDDVWASHVDEMSKYHAFVLPLENLDRVYNLYSVNNSQYTSIKELIKNSHGSKAINYIDDLIKDINGGVVQEAGTDILSSLTSKFKKNAVFASASVVVQQPSAIARALSEVDAKYFAKTTGSGFNRKSYEEMKKYAPVAIIKEMGYFDTNMAQNTIDYLNMDFYQGIKEKWNAFWKDGAYRDDVMTFFASKADEITWTHIWNAVKAETKANHPELSDHSEQLLKKAGERFTEVVTKTQVYDSVFSRSGLMRSRDNAVKNAMSFMAEPTTFLNMFTNAVVQAKRGKISKKQAGKVLGSLVAASVLNSLLQTIVTAARADDDDKEYAEVYLAQLLPNFIDNLNPINQIAFLKDIVSIFQGYDVTRADMNLFSDLYNAIQKFSSETATTEEKISGFAGALSAFFGFPLKNIIRDVKAAINVGKDIFDEDHFSSDDALDEFKNEMNSYLGFDLFNSDFENAVKGIRSGDRELYEKYADKVYESDSAYDLLYEVAKADGVNSSAYLNAKRRIEKAKEANGVENPDIDGAMKDRAIKDYAKERTRKKEDGGDYNKTEPYRQLCMQLFGDMTAVEEAFRKYQEKQEKKNNSETE